MTTILRPSDGAAREGPYLDLNWLRLRAGERVLIEAEHGRPEIGTIARVEGNDVYFPDPAMGPQGLRRVMVTAVKHRLRPAAGPEAEAALIARLEAAAAEAPHLYRQDRETIVKAWNRAHAPNKEMRG
jgi:hypothetical protein